MLAHGRRVGVHILGASHPRTSSGRSPQDMGASIGVDNLPPLLPHSDSLNQLLNTLNEKWAAPLAQPCTTRQLGSPEKGHGGHNSK